jgi:hypothetical protein
MLFAFRFQTSWPTAEVRVSLQSIPRLHAFLGVIKNLPELWNDLVARDPRLQDVSGADALYQLVAWLSGGTLYGNA